MEISKEIATISNHLKLTHERVDQWFSKPDEVRSYRPMNGGWTINEILEHIHLTSHYLLILIDKGKVKALKNVQARDLETELATYSFGSQELDDVGLTKSFKWIRPEHMEPKGANLDEIRNGLKDQLTQCLETLDTLGEGLLY